MHIDPVLLKSRGAMQKHYGKNDVVFYENEAAKFYYQIVEGTVKMFNDNNEGKQFLQGYFAAGQSFGEPPLLINENYPSTAIALADSMILRIPKEDFLELLRKYPDIKSELLQVFAERLYNKSVTAAEIVNHTPEARILSFLNSYKKKNADHAKVVIPFTRQIIADFTGLRVETVIRTLCRMKEMKKVDIINRKVIY